MSSFLYDTARQKFLGGDLDWDGHTIKALLVDGDAGTGYTPNQASDEYLVAIPVAARIATSGALTGKTTSGGVAGAADVVFAAVPSGTVCEYVVLYRDTGDAATSELIALLDSTAMGGLPVTPNGQDINVVWDTGAHKIFSL